MTDSHCLHCNHSKVNHGRVNGCSVCKRELANLQDRFYKDHPESFTMSDRQSALLWRKWAKELGLDNKKLEQQVICDNFEMLWYGSVRYDYYIPYCDNEAEKKALMNKQKKDKRIRIDIREVPCERAVEILTEQIRILKDEGFLQ